MKKIILTLSLMLIIQLSFSQNTITFNDTLFFSNGPSNIYGVCEDDSFYYMHTLNVATSLLKINKAGLVVKKKVYSNNYPSKRWSYPYNSFIIKDRYLYLCGFKTDSINQKRGLLICFDKYSLDTLWTKTYFHPYDSIVIQPGVVTYLEYKAINSTSDGGLIIIGDYLNEFLNERSILTKTDSLGNIQWWKTYSDINNIYSIHELPNGGYITTANYWTKELIVFDSFGNISWRKNVAPWSRYPLITNMAYTGNNCFVGTTISTFTNSIGYPASGINVFKVNVNNQQIVWSKDYCIFKGIHTYNSLYTVGISVSPSGDLYVSTNARIQTTTGTVLKLNSSGDSLWCLPYYYKDLLHKNCFWDMEATQDGGFIAVGEIGEGNPTGKAWFVKTDSSGIVGFNKEVANSTISKIDLYPNPANEVLNIALNKATLNPIEIQIYDVQGRLISCPWRKTSSVQVDVKKLNPGIYFVQMTFKNGLNETRKFVKR